MKPLQVQIMLGQQDDRLLEHIKNLEGFKQGFGGNARLSDGEKLTLQMCWDRLELITRPRPKLPPREYIYSVMMARSAELSPTRKAFP